MQGSLPPNTERPPAGRASIPSSSGVLGPRIATGQCITSRYVVRQFISNGATSRVYACEDLDTGAHVALKVVRHELDDGAGSFDFETSAYRCFHSPHLPALRDVGTLADGSRYMVLELVTGERLDARLARGPLAIAGVLELGRELMTALFHAHRAGYLHCDVKPQNVLLEARPGGDVLVKLVDFGTCAPTGDNPFGRELNERLRSIVVGTPSYMAPERMRGEPVDVRADVYAGAIVIYQALTGRLPFCGNTVEQIMQSAQRDPIVPARVLRENCPVELERALSRALCKDPGFRFPSARMLADELDWIAQKLAFVRGPSAWSSRASIPPARDPQEEADTTRRVPSVPKMNAQNGES
jgi:serine/threonine-protein kinase